MMHVVIPNMNGDRDSWGLGENDACWVIGDGNAKKWIEQDLATITECKKCVVIANPGFLIQRLQNQWQKLLLSSSDGLTVWWHIGGNDSKNFTRSSIKNRMNEFPASFISALKSVDPLPYSMNVESTPWDKTLQQLATLLKSDDEQNTSDNLKNLFALLDQCAYKAQLHYYGIQELKDLLANLFGPFVCSLEAKYLDLSNVQIDEDSINNIQNNYRMFAQHPLPKQALAGFQLLMDNKGQTVSLNDESISNLKALFELGELFHQAGDES